MYIHEAIPLAMAKGKFMRRATSDFWSATEFEPTDGVDGIIVHCKLNPAPCPRWQPGAEDLMANDWVLVD